MIDSCLSALLASTLPKAGLEVIVVTNGCTDDTAARARSHASAAQIQGVAFRVIDLPDGGKLGALNAGDAAAKGNMRAYLDADVIVTPSLIEQISKALDTTDPRYASGSLQISLPVSWATRAYRRFYHTVPFIRDGVPGCGIFAMNSAGRAQWAQWPDIISDDTFARLNFRPDQRVAVEASYQWPLVEGFGNLVRVRRRQNIGVAQIETLYPQLLANDDKLPYPKPRLIKTILADPIGFAVYTAVALAVKLGRNADQWTRGR